MRRGSKNSNHRSLVRVTRALFALTYGLALACSACTRRQSPPTAGEPVVVTASFPHDQTSFTEGLFYLGGFLYEGTGMEGQSLVKKVEIASGRELSSSEPLRSELFGEGTAAVGDELVQLTWKSHVALVYDLKTLAKKREVTYPYEGWGLASGFGDYLVASDGSSTLHVLDPKTLRQVYELEVSEYGKGVKNLNELEMVNGRLLANVWQENRIVIINTKSGKVEGQLRADTLLDQATQAARAKGQTFSVDDCLNGIAFAPDSQRLFLTGKRWPLLFSVALPESLRSASGQSSPP